MSSPAPQNPHAAAGHRSSGHGQSLWYKDVVIYQTHVRAFYDSNDDGIGDFPGLTSKLDYIRDLGVSATWLLPFYPSPLRDDGYDISEYCGVNPADGTLDDVRDFVEAAHARGLRVITELVINHSSDRHPWFQRARRAPRGSIERDFYVWSDTGREYDEARTVFLDSEASNWSWDPVARQYYWHRFYSHQPDLNFRNPHVMREITGVLNFWLDLGVDGFRLDAVPYLVEREGTGDEIILCAANLSETAQVVHLALADLEGRVPVDLFGGSRFPVIAGRPYALALPDHGFHWLKLLSAGGAEPRRERPLEAMDRPDLPPAMRPQPVRARG